MATRRPSVIRRRPLPSQSGIVGIINLSGTMCFLNSAIQGLMSSGPFIDWLKNNEESREHPMISAFYDIHTTIEHIKNRIDDSELTERQSITSDLSMKSSLGTGESPRIDLSEIIQDIEPILERYGVSLGCPDDAHLTLMAIIDELIREDSDLKRIFEIAIRVIQECSNCGYRSEKIERTNDLRLSWNEHVMTLDDILDMYLDPHRIPNTCPNCGYQWVLDESREIVNLPEVLIIVLVGRFTEYGQKVPEKIDYPGMIRMDTGEVFDLSSVINHQGSSTSGHYIATIKSNGYWWNVNDSVITWVPSERVQSPSNYILFYTKIHGFQEEEETNNI